MRIASQLTFCSPREIRRRMVVEQDGQKTVTRLFSLDENNVESAQTLFFDGIISAEIISVKENTVLSEKIISDYQYVDVSIEFPSKIVHSGKPLLLDFGSNSVEKISRTLKVLALIFDAFSAFEIIAACTYFPALILEKTASLSVNRNTQLLLWEGLDLVNKRITEHTRIREIN
jgi:hypothetical protein